MKRKIIVSIVVFVIAALAVSGAVYADALYSGNLMVSNNGTTTSDVASVFDLNSQAMIDSAMCESDFSDVSITYNGVQMVFQPGWNGNPSCIFVPDIGTATLNYLLSSKGATGGIIRYFPGSTGMSVPTGMTDLTDNFTLEFNDTFLDTSNATGKYIFNKSIALWSQINDTTSGQIDTYWNSTVLDFETTNSDAVNIPDAADLTFNVAGVDQPFSIMGWVNLESFPGAGTYYGLLSKSDSFAANRGEYWTIVDQNGYFMCNLSNTNGTAYIRKQVPVALTTGTWWHVAFTYSGSETLAGMKCYINGAYQSTTTNTTGGAYTGMSDTASELEFGTFNATYYLDGILSNWKIYDVEYSADQVLADYNNANATADLVTWYKLNDGAGNPADSSGLGHNATSNTADWISHGSPYSPLSITGIASAEYDVEYLADSTNISIYLNSVLQGSKPFGFGVADNATDWYLGGDATIYIGDIAYSKGGVSVSAWQWEHGATFYDSISTNDGTPSYRTTSSNPDVTAELVTFGPVDKSDIGSFSFSVDLPDIGTPETPSEMYTEGDYTHIPGADSANEMLDEAEVPRSLWWFPFIYIGICFIGLLSYGATQGPMAQSSTSNPFDGSLLIMAVVMEICMVIVGIMNPVPLFPAFLFPIPALAIIISRRHTSWG